MTNVKSVPQRWSMHIFLWRKNSVTVLSFSVPLLSWISACSEMEAHFWPIVEVWKSLFCMSDSLEILHPWNIYSNRCFCCPCYFFIVFCITTVVPSQPCVYIRTWSRFNVFQMNFREIFAVAVWTVETTVSWTVITEYAAGLLFPEWGIKDFWLKGCKDLG